MVQVLIYNGVNTIIRRGFMMEGQISFIEELLDSEVVEMKKDVDIDVDYISGSKAMQMLDVSRHAFEKLVKDGFLVAREAEGKKSYKMTDIK